MTEDGGVGKRPATLSGALFARKGAAAATGFSGNRPTAEGDPPAAVEGDILAAIRDPVDPPPVAKPRGTILIVEDNELNMKILYDVLDFHGYRVVQAKNGLDVLAIAHDCRPDLILLDLRLPDTCGLDVARLVKADGSLGGTKVIALTAYVREWNEAKVRDAGCDGYLSKPVALSSLHQVIQQALA